MPRQLWLLRHGAAAPHGQGPDAERALTEKGRRQSVAAGRSLARLGVEFEAVYVSPRKRALETAFLAAGELELSPHVHQPLHAGFTRQDADQLLAGCGSDARLLLVGHEPDFSQLVFDFTGGRIDLKKGGVAVVGVEEAALLVLLRPREIAVLAGVR
ncbi:MAG: phosphohistidine phosphatase [Solirubrobacteraceae bacterium]|jgi:phosphohistidine phosphatase|nr:phosphohistidine phosphatase [Solirubrobacteraceae bacterium]